MLKKERILVVDDDLDLVEAIKTVLESRSYDVAIATNGEECIRSVQEKKPDLIILDIMMSKKDGLTTCFELKRDPNYAQVPIMLLTGIASQLAKPDIMPEIALGHQADDYIEKPIDPAKLLKEVEKLLWRQGKGVPH